MDCGDKVPKVTNKQAGRRSWFARLCIYLLMNLWREFVSHSTGTPCGGRSALFLSGYQQVIPFHLSVLRFHFTIHPVIFCAPPIATTLSGTVSTTPIPAACLRTVSTTYDGARWAECICVIRSSAGPNTCAITAIGTPARASRAPKVRRRSWKPAAGSTFFSITRQSPPRFS